MYLLLCILFRYQLFNKKNKVDKISQKKTITNQNHQDVARCLNSCFHSEDYIDTTRPLCNSMISGTINTCKTRVINFVSTNRMYQGMLYRHFAEKVPRKEKQRHLQLIWFALSYRSFKAIPGYFQGNVWWNCKNAIWRSRRFWWSEFIWLCIHITDKGLLLFLKLSLLPFVA